MVMCIAYADFLTVVVLRLCTTRRQILERRRFMKRYVTPKGYLYLYSEKWPVRAVLIGNSHPEYSTRHTMRSLSASTTTASTMFVTTSRLLARCFSTNSGTSELSPYACDRDFHRAYRHVFVAFFSDCRVAEVLPLKQSPVHCIQAESAHPSYRQKFWVLSFGMTEMKAEGLVSSVDFQNPRPPK